MDDKQNETPEPKEQIEVEKVEVVKSKLSPAKQLHYFTVKMEVSAPVVLEYKILAETPEQALEMANKALPGQFFVSPPKPNLSKMKRLKASIYLAGTSLLKLTKNF